MQSSSEKLFVVLAGTETKKYTFDIATEEEILMCKSLIKLIQIENSCMGNELIEICYGVGKYSPHMNIGNVPSFFIPLHEENNPQLYINNINSILGHIKLCLEHGLTLFQHPEQKRKIKQLRHEAITNFRVQRPISLCSPPNL